VSEIIGMNGGGYSAFYSGNDAEAAGQTGIPYSVIMNTIFETEQLATPIFVITLSRDSSGRGFGGYFTIGGTPGLDLPEIQRCGLLQYCSFRADLILCQCRRTQYGTSTISSGFDSTSRFYAVDSGTAFLIMPSEDAAAIAKLYSPAATIYGGLYRVDCTAAVPNLSFKIAGKAFAINPEDMM
jgi:hypothetical protein